MYHQTGKVYPYGPDIYLFYIDKAQIYPNRDSDCNVEGTASVTNCWIPNDTHLAQYCKYYKNIFIFLSRLPWCWAQNS